MEKKNYIVGPKIKVWGPKRISRIMGAMREIGLPENRFSVGIVTTIPVMVEYGEYHIISHDMEDLKLLPADFAERIQEIVDPKMAGK